MAGIIFALYLSGKIIPVLLCYKLWRRRREARRRVSLEQAAGGEGGSEGVIVVGESERAPLLAASREAEQARATPARQDGRLGGV